MYKKIKKCSWLLCLSITLLSCTYGNQISTERLFEHVVIIGIDGLTIEGLKQGNTPIMDNLIATGAVKYNARTVIPTSTVPNWGAMIHGAGPEATGITSNRWMQPAATNMTPVVSNEAGVFPCIFHVVRTQLPDAEQSLFINWDGFGFTYHFERLRQRGVLNRFDIFRQGDIPLHYSAERTTERAIEYIIAERPTFFFVILNHVDGTGHDYGFTSEEYMWSVWHADKMVGRIMEAIDTAGMKNNTLVMVLSDHGGIGYRHGGETDTEIDVPFIFWGNGVKQNYEIQQPIYVFDVAATVAFALNLRIPFAWTGRPVLAAFEGYEEPDLSF